VGQPEVREKNFLAGNIGAKKGTFKRKKVQLSAMVKGFFAQTGGRVGVVAKQPNTTREFSKGGGGRKLLTTSKKKSPGGFRTNV